VLKSPEGASYGVRGDVFAKQQEWDRAIEDYERAKIIDSRLEQTLRQRAKWHQAAGRSDAAKKDTDRADRLQALFD